jgi:hypothetical protein
MMKSKKLSIVVAVLALIISTLACSFGSSEPTLSNVRTAKDENGDQTSSVFSTTDTIYVVGDISNGKQGNVVSSKWMVSNVEGYDPGYVIDSVDLTLDKDQFSYSVNFFFEPPTDGWPAGTYKVEVSFNGVLNSTVEYTVQ